MTLSGFPYRWRVVVLLFFLSVLNYFDRQTLSVLEPALRHDLGFSTIQYSYVVTSFLVALSVGYLFCGSITDRWGLRLSVIVALSIWTFASVFHVLATTWIGLAVCRFVLGFGESFNAPCGIKGIAEWVPRRERGLSIAIFSNGNIVGAVLAPPVISFVSVHFGWRWGFLITGLLGLIYLLIWTLFYDSPEKKSQLPAEELAYIVRERGSAAKRPPLSLLETARHPAVIGFFIARLLTDSLSFFIYFWLPEYLHNARGFSLSMIGLFGWIPFLASDIGGPGGGALSDWLIRRGWHPVAARKRLMLGAALLMPCALLAVYATSVYVAIGFIALLLAAQSCWLSNILALMSELFPSDRLATFVSFSSLGGAIGGVISTLVAGQIIQNMGYVPVFTVLGFLHLTAFGVLFYFLRRKATLVEA